MCSDARHDDWPSELALNPRCGTLEMVWDGAPAALTYRDLRSACRCSVCESARRAGMQPPLDAGLNLRHLEVLGSTGLQLFFSDGHSRGIYPWPYLRALAYPSTSKGAT